MTPFRGDLIFVIVRSLSWELSYWEPTHNCPFREHFSRIEHWRSCVRIPPGQRAPLSSLVSYEGL